MAFNLNEYEPVEVRLARFWAEHPNGRVLTELIHHGEGQFIVRTALFREGDNQPFATGYAEELVTTRGVNQTSALENCETSSTGRALANAGYAPKGKRPSLEEMQKASVPVASQQPPNSRIYRSPSVKNCSRSTPRPTSESRSSKPRRVASWQACTSSPRTSATQSSNP